MYHQSRRVISHIKTQATLSRRLNTICQDALALFQDVNYHIKTHVPSIKTHVPSIKTHVPSIKTYMVSHTTRVTTNLFVRYPQSRRTSLSPECNVTFELLLNWLRSIYVHENLPTEYYLYVHFPQHWCYGTDTFLPT